MADQGTVPAQKAKESPREDVKNILCALGKEGDRQFTFIEVSKFMRTFGENLTTKEIDDMLNEPGFNGEKTGERLITYEEFFKMLTSK